MRPQQFFDAMTKAGFQSTHPMRDATTRLFRTWPKKKAFQSTHPMRDATRLKSWCLAGLIDFNPRIPCGMRPLSPVWIAQISNFNPRRPCGLRPQSPDLAGFLQGYFNPRIPCGMRLGLGQPRLVKVNFNPRIPCGMRLLAWTTSCWAC